MVLEAYPDAASLPTSDGLCPLHCAMIIGQEWNFAVLQVSANIPYKFPIPDLT